ncbi:MAG: VOC family protein [Pseudonocardiaceae bacterium]|nr:VOC family protein [Pseudonocardiaceae bacterium]
MPVHLDHTVIPAHDKAASAEFLARILGLQVGTDPFGYFSPLELGNNVIIEFADAEDFYWHHYAFLVSEEEFDAAFARITGAGLDYHAGPLGGKGEIYFHSGGRGVYFDDPNGHHMEIVTVPSSKIGPDTRIRTGPFGPARGN